MKMLKNNYKLTRFEDKFVIEVRCGGRGEEFVGRMAAVTERSGKMRIRTLVRLLKDYGKGDIAIFEVD